MNRPPRQAAAPPISQSPCFSTGGTVIQRRRLVRLYPSVLFFSLDQEKHNWVMTSIYFMELLAGVVMLIIGALLVLFRWPELCQVRDAVNETETRILRRAAIYCRTVAQKQHPACGLLTTGGGGSAQGRERVLSTYPGREICVSVRPVLHRPHDMALFFPGCRPGAASDGDTVCPSSCPYTLSASAPEIARCCDTCVHSSSPRAQLTSPPLAASPAPLVFAPPHQPDCWHDGHRTTKHQTPAPANFRAQVWQLHRRIKCYIVLSVIATVVDLAIGIGGVVYVVYEKYKPALIVATWTMRCASEWCRRSAIAPSCSC